jgi:hypothetical protein
MIPISTSSLLDGKIVALNGETNMDYEIRIMLFQQRWDRCEK